MSGTLFLVATPLGNVADLSPRAVSTLREADVLMAEDTRTAQRLLTELGIRRAVISCHDVNEAARAELCREHLRAGRSVALIAEAGTPAICDPGYRIVQAALAEQARVVPVPGPSAVLAALVASGLPTDRFYFGGFLPRKPGARRAALQAVAGLDATLVFFESPLRTAATLQDCLAVLGDRAACVARELSKTHEDFVRESVAQLCARYADRRPLGEITLVIAGQAAQAGLVAQDDEAVTARARELLAQGASVRDVIERLVQETGATKKRLYPLVLAARPEHGDDA